MLQYKFYIYALDIHKLDILKIIKGQTLKSLTVTLYKMTSSIIQRLSGPRMSTL
jgi:hypothetical protein